MHPLKVLSFAHLSGQVALIIKVQLSLERLAADLEEPIKEAISPKMKAFSLSSLSV